MSKKKLGNRRNIHRSVKLCDPSRCDCCQYIGEGDFLCDKHMEVVAADWMPTERFMMCDNGWRLNMIYSELKRVFCDWKRDHHTQDLTAHVVFTEDSFDKEYSLLSRTYRFNSGEKAFWSKIGSRSIFAYCLDKTSNQGVRLDWYMEEEGNPGGWKVQDCYILERMRDVADIPNAERVVQPDGTVCYFFGDTTIQVNESLQDGTRKLEPIAGDQAAYGEWEDLSMDQVCGYCFLLEKHLNGGEII